MNKQIEEPFS